MEEQLISMSGKKSGPKKGVKFSDEHRRRLSETKKRQFKEGKLANFIGGKGKNNLQYGVVCSEEERLRRKERMMGGKNPFYGKTHSKEIMAKIQSHPGYKNRNIPTGDEHWFNKMSEDGKKLFINKIKKANTGRKNPHLSAMNSANVGDKNHSWQGGISFEPYDASFNNKFKRAIRKRDNQICMLCNIHREKLKRALSVHHVNYDKLLSIPQNCISLCDSCHTKTGHNRKHWKTFFQNLLSEKYNYKYEDKEVIVEIAPVGERSGLF